MEYKDTKTPEQLLKYMIENIKYGFVDDNEKAYGPWDNQEFQEGCLTKWHLSSPERLIKVGYGHCWDQVELERDWFKKNNYNFKTLYIWFEFPYNNSYSTHTYLLFEKGKKSKKYLEELENVKYKMGADAMDNVYYTKYFIDNKYDGIIHIKSSFCTP